jgi:hypothetical protein
MLFEVMVDVFAFLVTLGEASTAPDGGLTEMVSMVGGDLEEQTTWLTQKRRRGGSLRAVTACRRRE